MAAIQTCFRFCQLNQFNKYRKPFIHLLIRPTITSSTIDLRLCHNTSNDKTINESNNGKDLEELFLDSNVQAILKRLTGFSVEKIFKVKHQLNIKSPKYKFMTDRELQMV